MRRACRAPCVPCAPCAVRRVRVCTVRRVRRAACAAVAVCWSLQLLTQLAGATSGVAQISFNATSNSTNPQRDGWGDLLETRNLVNTGVVALTVFVCSSSGIGGGALLVPLYILVLQRSPHTVVPLCLQGPVAAHLPLPLAVVDAAPAALSAGHHPRRGSDERGDAVPYTRHPFADRPAVDYSAALVFELATLAGTIVGVLLGMAEPPELLTRVCAVRHGEGHVTGPRPCSCRALAYAPPPLPLSARCAPPGWS